MLNKIYIWKRFSLINTVSISLLIWVVTYIVWTNIPVEPSMFIDTVPDIPNLIYPSSDSFYYDKESLRLLEGEKFIENSTHVMYSFFLSGLHAINGYDYKDIIPSQIAVFSLIPTLIYLISTKISSQFAGMLIAGLYILRERSGLILASELSTGAVVNQLMTENLALLCLLVIIYLVIKLLQDEDKKVQYLILIGGMVGISLLVRIDLLAAFTAMSLGFLYVMWNNKRQWLISMLIITVTVALVLAPWMYRYSQSTGHLSIDKGGFVSRRISEYISSIKPDKLDRDESRPITESYGGVYSGDIKILAKHLINNIQMSVLFLPNSHQPFFTIYSFLDIDGLDEITIHTKNGAFSEKYIHRYIKSLPFFWYTWDGKLPFRSIIPLFASMLFISVGIRKTWKSNSHIVIILLLAGLGHYSAWALAGFSGGRFIKILDWITLLFYGIGLSNLFQYFISPFNFGRVNILQQKLGVMSALKEGQRNLFTNIGLVLVSITLIGIGWGPTIAETLIPQKFSDSQLLKHTNDLSLTRERTDSLIFLYGRGLYPRYYSQNERPTDNRRGKTPDPTIERLDFYLIGTRNIWVSLPVEGYTNPFHHGAVVIVEGMLTTKTNDTSLIGEQQPYFLAQKIYILSNIMEPEVIGEYTCKGISCAIDENKIDNNRND